jgi:mannosyltransferase
MSELSTPSRSEAGFAFLHDKLGRFAFWLFCGLICLLGLALRLPRLASMPLWLDETYSAWFSSLPLRELWTDAPLYETHPPFYYTLLKGWSYFFGTTEAALRSLSVAASVAAILLVAMSARILRLPAYGDRMALTAALLLALNRGNIFYAQEARPYALQTLTASLAILSGIALFHALRVGGAAAQDRRSTVLPLLALGISGGLTLWMHNTAIFIAFGLWTGLAVAALVYLPGRRVRSLAAIAIAGLLALLIWSPFLPMFIAQSQMVQTMSFWVTARISDLWAAWYLIAGGDIPFPLVIAMLTVGLFLLWRIDRPLALLLTTILLLPMGFVLVINFAVKPLFIDRLFEWMVPLCLVVVSFGLFHAPYPARLRFGFGTLIVILSLISSLTLHMKPRAENWRGLVQTIADNAQAGDVVIALSSEINPALRYYTRDRKTFPNVVLVPGAFPYRSPGRHYIGNLGAPKIEPSDRLLVRAALKNHKRVWLVSRAQFLYDPEDIVMKEIGAARKLIHVYQKDIITVALFE